MSELALRIFPGPDSDPPQDGPAAPENTVTVPLGDILPLLADAYHSQRTWLRDFDNEPITISTDLHEVALAYQHYRRPSA